MAKSELTQQSNPFSDTGNHVFGERFVGRQDQVQKLQDYCTTSNWSVQGLPHTGKTSLVWHSIIHNRDKVYSKYPLCVVYVCVDGCNQLEELYSSLVIKAYESVREGIEEESEKNRLDNIYALVKMCNFRPNDVTGFFQQIQTFNVSVLIILDRFDYIIKLKAQTTDLSNLRAILVPNVHFILISIQSIDSIENKVGKEAGSVLSQLFSSTIIPLAQYDEQDLVLYWERLKPYYEEAGLCLDDEYKKKAQYYTGNDPFLLDTYNNDIYNNRGNSSRNQSLALIRSYNSSIRALEKEDLLKPAIQAILGPVYNLDAQQMLDLLQQGFLRTVSEADKQALLGHSMGQVDVHEETRQPIAYVAKTDYFTLLFKKAYFRQADFWEEWSATFRSLQLLCLYFFETMWGNDWENHTEVKAIKTMHRDRKKDEDCEITPSPLIDYLRETSIGELIKNYWTTFEPVFAPITQERFMRLYNIVTNHRNHHAHINTRFLTDTDRTTANQYLKEIGQKVDAWNMSDKKLTPPVQATTSTPRQGSPNLVQALTSTSRQDILLNEGEYLGQMKVSQMMVQIKRPNPPCPSFVFIDSKAGYRIDYSPKEYDYEEDQWVVCKLKPQERNGRIIYHVIDIHPVDE